jgi:hypothetical protein
MTAEHLAESVRSPEPEKDGDRRGIPAATLLAMCDRVLGEVGRRRHMFAWLRVPGSASEEWLPVDAYYPRARLVVICRDAPGPHDGLYREQVPAHGLGLLTLDPNLMGDDEAAIEAALAARIFDLEHVPRPAAATDSPAPAWTPVRVERTPMTPALEQGMGLLIGVALAVVLIAEVYLGVVNAAFGAGRVVLGLAIALDACSRALGTVAAARAGERAWSCACALIGSPAVAWYAFGRRTGRAHAEPAPFAGLLAGVAVVVAVLALLLGL